MMNKVNFILFVPTRACALCMPSMNGLTSTPSPTIFAIFAIPAKAVCTFVYFDFAHTYAFYLDIPSTSQVSLRFRVYFYSDQCMVCCISLVCISLLASEVECFISLLAFSISSALSPIPRLM